ncbi:MAG: hypothetical protein DRG78_08530 [Epsilonproteobacteria bacterium]|nr:MAG: hypothetical protein DRG78_08530 [Campylobacterota bacterium]
MENKELTVNDTKLTFAPLSLTSLNAQELKDILIIKLTNCTHLMVDLKDISEFDIAGLQIIKGLENHSILNGLEFSISNIPEVVSTKLSIMGITL